MNILITGGGSEEPIDNVRYISNFSTGTTACFFAEYFCRNGHDVTLITAIKSRKPEDDFQNLCPGSLNVITYRTFNDLKNALEKECRSKTYDAVIHAAAVSDYSVSSIIVDGKEYEAGSIPKVSGGLELTVKMKKNPKLVDFIKQWETEGAESSETAPASKTAAASEGKKADLKSSLSKSEKAFRLVAFKLTSEATVEERKKAVQKVFASTGSDILSPDFVVSNDLSEITKEKHPCTIYRKDMSEAKKVENLEELSEALEELIKK